MVFERDKLDLTYITTFMNFRVQYAFELKCIVRGKK